MIYLIALLFLMFFIISLVMMWFSDHEFAWLVSALVSMNIWFFIAIGY